MRMFPAGSLALVVALAACQPASRDDGPASPRIAASPPVADSADRARPQPADRVIRGQATYRERIKMPAGASLVVELIALDAAPPRVVASTRVRDVAGTPIPFALPYDASTVRAGVRHALRATLLGAEGERWFETATPVPVVPGEETAVELLLRRAPGDAPAAASAAAATGPRHWECGDLGVMTRAGVEGLRVDANARTWTLAPVPGGGYGSDAASFRDAGGTGHLLIDGEPARDCVPARQASPWNEALLRGVAFRAVGNEPGWSVEVGRGDAPRLRAMLDYGDRRLDLDVQRSGAAFTGTADGAPLRLDITRSACIDGMSGQRFESSVSLQVGTTRYSGCGGWLAD